MGLSFPTLETLEATTEVVNTASRTAPVIFRIRRNIMRFWFAALKARHSTAEVVYLTLGTLPVVGVVRVYWRLLSVAFEAVDSPAEVVEPTLGTLPVLLIHLGAFCSLAETTPRTLTYFVVVFNVTILTLPTVSIRTGCPHRGTRSSSSFRHSQI